MLANVFNVLAVYENVQGNPFYVHIVYNKNMNTNTRTLSRPNMHITNTEKNDCFFSIAYFEQYLTVCYLVFFLHATNKALSLCVTQLCLRDSFSLIMRFFLSFSQQTTRRKNNEHEKKNTEKVERWVTRENICTVCERVFGVYALQTCICTLGCPPKR